MGIKKENSGYILAEILVVVALSSFFITTIVKSMSVYNRVTVVNTKRALAQAYAQESIEMAGAFKNDLFACSCSADVCTGSTCTRSSDGQSCQRFSAYSSCWTVYPKDLASENDFYFDESDGWKLKALAGTEDLGNGFSRKLTIEDALRDANGNLAEAGTADPGSKVATALVWYEYKGRVYSVELKALLTSWENI